MVKKVVKLQPQYQNIFELRDLEKFTNQKTIFFLPDSAVEVPLYASLV
jgi:hypothetical protein